MSQLLKQLGHALGRKQTEARHQPSGLMNAMPTCSAGIESCIKDTAEIIRTVRTGLDKNTRESVIEGNSPFLIKSRPVTETSCQRVVLMIHGLTDSPFVTRDLARIEAAISAASILAKVTRDHEMVELDEQYPGYGFASHKGYPSKQHLQALQELGICPEHRCTYAPVRRVLEQDAD